MEWVTEVPTGRMVGWLLPAWWLSRAGKQGKRTEMEALISKQAIGRCPQGRFLPEPWPSVCAAGRDVERPKSKWPPG